MEKQTYKAINYLIIFLFLLTFFFQVYPFFLPKENILSGSPTLMNRLMFTSGLYQLQAHEYGDFLLMNSMFVLFFVGNKLLYKVNKNGNY